MSLRNIAQSMRIQRLSRSLFIGLMFVPLGCTEAWRPTPLGQETVRGHILLGRTPVAGGWVEFIPIDGATGRIRSAPIQADGSFVAEGVARGRNVLRIVHPPESSRVETRFQTFQTPVRPEIRPDQPLEIDLLRPPTWTGTKPPNPGPSRANFKEPK